MGSSQLEGEWGGKVPGGGTEVGHGGWKAVTGKHIAQ